MKVTIILALRNYVLAISRMYSSTALRLLRWIFSNCGCCVSCFFIDKQQQTADSSWRNISFDFLTMCSRNNDKESIDANVYIVSF